MAGTQSSIAHSVNRITESGNHPIAQQSAIGRSSIVNARPYRPGRRPKTIHCPIASEVAEARMSYRRIASCIPAAALAVLVTTPTAVAQGSDQSGIAAINLSYVARASQAGKSAIARIDEATRQKEAEAAAKAAALDKQQAALQQQGNVMSARARADLQRAFDKSRVEFERFQEDAQAELQGMQAKFEAEFRIKLMPVVEQISKEKGLRFVFGIEQSTMIAWWSPAVDISDEVVERLDAARK
jgi:Skp family chaperone for outer membrane proteins